MFDGDFRILSKSSTAIGWVNGTGAHKNSNPEELQLVAGRITRSSDSPVIAHLGRAQDYSINMIKRIFRAAIDVGCAGITISDGERNGSQV